MTIKFNMVVFRNNYKQMIDVAKLAAELKVQEIFFNTFNLVANNFDLKLYDFYRSQEFRMEFNQALTVAKELGIYIGYRDIDSPKGFEFCGYPWDDFYITWDGYSVPCCAKPFPKELNFGNIFKDGMMPILNNRTYKEFRQLSQKNITPDFCQRCHKVS